MVWRIYIRGCNLLETFSALEIEIANNDEANLGRKAGVGSIMDTTLTTWSILPKTWTLISGKFAHKNHEVLMFEVKYHRKF